MNSLLVSIIIPTYNRAHLIGETLDSILMQTYTNWECIIVDDGSIDNTENVIENYVDRDSRFRFYHRPKNLLGGGNAARNYGFQHSKGEFTNWFDSDDIMHKDHLKLHMQNFEYNPSIGLSCSKAWVFQNTVENVVEEFFPDKMTSENLVYDLVAGKMFFLTPCTVWKNEDKLKNILWDETLLMAQESDLNYRRALEGISFAFIENTVFVRRGHQSIDSQTEKDVYKIQSQFDYFSKILGSLNTQHLNNDLIKFKKLRKYVLLRLLVFYSQIKLMNNLKGLPYNHDNKRTVCRYSKFLEIEFLDKIRIYVGINAIWYFNKGYSLIYIKKFKLNE